MQDWYMFQYWEGEFRSLCNWQNIESGKMYIMFTPDQVRYFCMKKYIFAI